MKQLVFLLFLIPGPLALGWITESEPNNSAQQGDLVQCGDTVYCGQLPGLNDYDYFRFQAIAGDSLILITKSCLGSQTDTWLTLFDDHDSILAVNNDSGEMYFALLRYAITRTANYYARVLRLGTDGDSTYSLIINCPVHVPEAYDLCQTPRIAASLPYYNEGSTAGATHQTGTPSPDVFYKFYNPVVGNYTITVCSDLFDARVQIFGFCYNDFREDESIGCNLGAVLRVFSLPVGFHYLLVEGTAANQIGNFSIEIVPQLTECPTPQPVVLTKVGGYPFLDWPESEGPTYYIIWHSSSMVGEYEHLGTSIFTFFADSTGYAYNRHFYKVTAVCAW